MKPLHPAPAVLRICIPHPPCPKGGTLLSPPRFSPLFPPLPVELTSQDTGIRQVPERGGPPPLQIEVPLRPPPGGPEYHDLPPHLRHMRGYPHPMSGTISPTESPSRTPSFRVQNGWVPPLWCPDVPPHPIRSRPLLRSWQGPASRRPPPPTYVRRRGEYPLSSWGGTPMSFCFASAFPHLCMELTTEHRNFRPVSDRGDTPHLP